MCKEDDTSAEEYLKRGDEALKARIYDRATENYGKAIEKDPENYLGFYKRALSFIQRGRSKSAIKDFSSVLKLKSDHVAVRRTLLSHAHVSQTSTSLSHMYTCAPL